MSKMVRKFPFMGSENLGELIAAQKATVGLNTGTRGQLAGRDASGGTNTEPPENKQPTLAEAGIDKKLSGHARGDQKTPKNPG
ncbi:MAG: hypothetical protein IPN63_07790 [Gammaproteobacteria bacterium]|nr:hypothetical protein [Gammaproteobacteria bacterium]MBK9427276.1 hypothetical protein [Gammaproteobacteria bacterium]